MQNERGKERGRKEGEGKRGKKEEEKKGEERGRKEGEENFVIQAH